MYPDAYGSACKRLSVAVVPDMSKLNDKRGDLTHQGHSKKESALMLTGRRVLVLESEFIIALALETVLATLGASHVTLSSDVEQARAKSTDWADAALALIELEAGKPETFAFAREVVGLGIPVLGISADAELAMGVPDLPGTPIVIKPLTDESLIAAIENLIDQNPLPDVT